MITRQDIDAHNATIQCNLKAIKPGDIVYLKSGSGELTAASISTKKIVTVVYSPYGGDGTVMKARVPLLTLRKKTNV